MKHAREDYGHIQDRNGKIPDEEPVFLLRGQDPIAPLALDYYADVAEDRGCSAELVRSTREHADLMRAWPVKKRNPDL